MRYVTEIPQEARGHISTVFKELNRSVNNRGFIFYDMAENWIVCMMYAILFHKQDGINAKDLFISSDSLEIYSNIERYCNAGEKHLEMNYEFQDRLDGLFAGLPEDMAGWQQGGRCFIEKRGPHNPDVKVQYMDCTKQDMSAFSYRIEDTIRGAKNDEFAFELYLVRVINKRLGTFLSMPEMKQSALYAEIQFALDKIMGYRGIHSCEMQITEHGCELCFFFSKSPHPDFDEQDIHGEYFGFSYYNTPLCGDPFLLVYAKELDCLLNEAFELYQIKE